MKSKLKKIMSVVIIFIIAAGAYVSVFGAGPIKNIKEALNYGLDIDGGVYVEMQANTGSQSGSTLKKNMEQTKEVLTKRVNAMGVSEATVSIEGNNKLRVEMPGVKDAKDAINRIGQTAKLKFTLADGTEYLTGNNIKTAAAETDTENGGYKITMKFKPEGQKKFAEATERAASGSVTPTITDSNGSTVSKNSVVIWLDNKVLTYPTADNKIDDDSCEITQKNGGYTKAEATKTAALIRGGALPLSLHEVSSSVQTASIGANALNKSIVAGAIGLGLVFVLMILMYNLLGIFADLALTLYVMLVLWIMSSLGAVLTLPGIAGIILGIGMAVDSNVIIFARIKEEIGLGRSIRAAVDLGFKHALATVIDSQVTTLIAAIIMYELGSTTVKGFAVTLIIGIVVSIFTAVVVSQILIGTLADSRFARNAFFGCKQDGTPKRLVKRQFNFIKNRKIFYFASAVVIVAGLVTFGIRGFNYGIDFTGGTMIQMNLGQKVAISEVQKTIKAYDLNADIVYSGADKHEVIIKTTKALNADGRDKIQKTIEKAYNIKDSSVVSSEEFGASIGKEIRNNAILAIILASLGVLLYMIVRFKSWKYGVAGIAGILHDVLVLIAVYAIFGITVNNPFIAAILTVVGYSINDTIVIFDRVRENTHLMRGATVGDILDHSINQTLDRSVMTSMTAIISIIPLLFLVSAQLSQFVLPLIVGIATGTYSSIFLCSPLYFEFNKKSEASKYLAQQKAKQRIEAKKDAKHKKPEAEQIETRVENIEADTDTEVITEIKNKPAKNVKKGTGGSKSKSKSKKKRKH